MDILTLVALALALASGGAPMSGWAYTYHPWPDPGGRSMRQVAAVRGIALDWSVDGYASTPRCDRIGGYLAATVAGQPVTLQVIDCSAPADLRHQLRPRSAGGLGLVLEVDWSLAHAQGWATYGGDHGPGRAPATVWGWWPAPARPGIQTMTVAVRPVRRGADALAQAHVRRDGGP